MLIKHTLQYLPAQLLSPLAQLASMILWTHWLAPVEMGVFTLVSAQYSRDAIPGWWLTNAPVDRLTEQGIAPLKRDSVLGALRDSTKRCAVGSPSVESGRTAPPADRLLLESATPPANSISKGEFRA